MSEPYYVSSSARTTDEPMSGWYVETDTGLHGPFGSHAAAAEAGGADPDCSYQDEERES
jgi:hypothetical protein